MPKTLLAFSGGLDTSWCVLHLVRDRGHSVTAVTFDVGGLTPDERRAVAARALSCGAESHQFLDLRAELSSRVLVPLIQSGYLKGGNYPLCVGAERGLQAEALAKMALAGGYDAVAHGCTPAGNDQVRFDVTLSALLPPGTEIIAPMRELAAGREEIAARLEAAGLAVERKTATYSVNSSLWGTTLGGGPLHDPAVDVPDDLRHKVLRPRDVTAPDEEVALRFAGGVPVALNGADLPLADLLEKLNATGEAHGVGRGVHLGDTVLGIKGRIVFEAPAAILVHFAHRELAKLTLSKRQLELREQIVPFYGRWLHEGMWLDPVMEDIAAWLAHEQECVTGEVVLALGRGTLELRRLSSPNSRLGLGGTYGEDARGWDGRDAEGFGRILGLGVRRP